MRLSRRWTLFVLAMVIMVLFRPHVALVALSALALSAFFEGRFGPLARATLVALTIGGAAIVASTVETTFSVNVADPESVSEFFSRQHKISQQIEGGTAVHDASFPFKLLSLLFRPFFVDANGIFALISSFENVFMLFVFGSFLANPAVTMRLARSVFFLRFVFIFALATIVLLALVYYNVGLGVRQRVMVMPALLSFFVAHWTVQRMKRSRHQFVVDQRPG